MTADQRAARLSSRPRREHGRRAVASMVVAVFVVLAMVGAACGTDDGDDGASTSITEPSVTTTEPGPTVTSSDTGATGSQTSSTSGESTRFVDVYFVQGQGYATAVPIAVGADDGVAANAVRALIAGPTEAQQAIGLSSSVPTATELLGLTIDRGVATIDLSSHFEAGGGTFAMTARLGQVVYTLTDFPTIDEVEFWIDGRPVTEFSSEGIVLDGPVGRADYLSALPLTPPTGGPAMRWTQDDLPDLVGAELRRVVLVPAEDVLNVRGAAGVENEIIGMLVPPVVVGLTGPRADVGASTWSEIVAPVGAGWVNDHFLAEVIDNAAFADDTRVSALLDRFAATITDRGDLSDLASERGLYVSHHDDPIRISPDALPGVLSDPTTYKWPSNALDVNDPDQASEIPERTFAEAVADSFVSVWVDEDRELAFDRPMAGGNGRPPSSALWPELAGFHFVSIHDPGDNPEFGGLDWTIWHVSIDYEDGRPVIVGLTIDQWAP